MRLIHCGVAAWLMLGCASPAMPPGGPPDVEAPRLIGIAPDSGRVSVSPRNVVFRFDEVVSERPPSVTSLANLFVISPQHGTPVVNWRRDEILVRPRRGWRPNTVYSVRMLPGLSDLRGNVRREGAATLFATGATIPATAIAGVLYDWAAGRTVPAGLVQAMTADSTIYMGYSDSSGVFTLPYLPPGSYEVTGVVDGNNNRALDPRELWDTLTVSLTDTVRVELFAFRHDSAGPRIESVVASDSMTLRIRFDKPIDARTPLDPSWVRVAGPDSLPLPVAGVALPDTAPADSAAADTVAAAPLLPSLVMPRPRPYTEVVVTMAAPLRAGTTYTVVTMGFPSLIGRTERSSRAVAIPEPAPAAAVPPPTPP